MTGLYEIFDIPRDATKNEIRKAYRSKAKNVHPDKMGGSRTAFETVKKAYDILIDDERRARYDETGTVEEAGPDNSRPEAIMRMITAIKNAVTLARGKAGARQMGMSSGPAGNPMAFDMIALAKNNLVDHIAQVEAQKAEFLERRVLQADLAQRFKRIDGQENLIADVFWNDLRDTDVAIKSCENEIVMSNAALELLDGYVFEREVYAPPEQQQFFIPAMGFSMSKGTG
jgi:curved DNA-binding protein CbpA